MMTVSILKQTTVQKYDTFNGKVRVNTVKSLKVKKSLAPGKTKSCRERKHNHSVELG